MPCRASASRSCENRVEAISGATLSIVQHKFSSCISFIKQTLSREITYPKIRNIMEYNVLSSKRTVFALVTSFE